MRHTVIRVHLKCCKTLRRQKGHTVIRVYLKWNPIVGQKGHTVIRVNLKWNQKWQTRQSLTGRQADVPEQTTVQTSGEC